VAGNGSNVIYDILPGTTSITVGPHGNKTDYLFYGPQGTLTGATANDRVAQFFAPGRTPGAGTLVLDPSTGTLYFTANNNGDTYVASSQGQNVYVVYDLNDGQGFRTASFPKSQVKLLANFGGAGNDILINTTDIPDVQYGAGGVNVLFGGYGELNLEKAGGGAAGGSIVVGNSPRYNDLNGSGQTGAQNTLVFNRSGAQNIARTNSPSDIIFGLNQGTLVSLYPDQIIAALLPPYVPA
jgi:hypothetical protein